MKLLFVIFVVLLVGLVLPASVGALWVETLPDQVLLRIPLQGDASFRVWHTNNPMKVIVDLDHPAADEPSVQGFYDVALQQLRTSPRPDTSGTRIVLDFRYQLPEPQWSVENGLLHVTVDKVFNWSAEHGIAQGVRYGHQRRGSVAGPLVVNYLDAKITDPDIEFRSVLAQDQIFGRERVSSMAVRGEAIAAVNGAYFAADGRPLGVLAIQGELISEPFASRTAIGLGKNQVVMGSLDAVGVVETLYGTLAITGMNRPRVQDDLILYTPHYGAATNTNVFGLDVLVRDGQVVRIQEGGMDIPEDAVVLSGHGTARTFLGQLRPGDVVQYSMALTPDWFSRGITEIIGGGPRLVKNGQVHVTGVEERFQNDITQGRAPRTALGITADKRLLVVTVNGRIPNVSVGMTLLELADLMIELGAVDAMNLDGGGSTTMFVRNRVLNIPSDGTERPVSNGLIIITPESRR